MDEMELASETAIDHSGQGAPGHEFGIVAVGGHAQDHFNLHPLTPFELAGSFAQLPGILLDLLERNYIIVHAARTSAEDRLLQPDGFVLASLLSDGEAHLVKIETFRKGIRDSQFGFERLKRR